MPQARRLIELRRILATVLPGSLARRSSIANIKQGKLVVFAASGAVAAKLRLLSPALLEQLSKRGIEVTVLEVRVQPPLPLPQVPEKSAKMSLKGASNLIDLCRQLPDSELKKALSQLARKYRA